MFVNLRETFLLFAASLLTVISELNKCEQYRGCVNFAHNGEQCANWVEVNNWGDEQFVTKDNAIKNGIGDHNYCRNPGGLRSGPWCYHKDDTKQKVYCPIDKCFYKPEEDPKCPDNTFLKLPNRKSSPVFRGLRRRPAPAPKISVQYVMLNQSLTLKCSSEYTGAAWQSGPELETRKLDSLVIDPVTEKTAGDWRCTCRARQYITRVIVCHVVWSECELVGTGWRKTGFNNCTGEIVNENVVCMEDEREYNRTKPNLFKSGTQGQGVRENRQKLNKFRSVEAKKGKLRGVERETEDRPDNAAGPSLCEERYRSVCEVTQGYIIGALLTVLMFAAVHHLKRSREWRRRVFMSRVQAVAGLTPRQNCDC